MSVAATLTIAALTWFGPVQASFDADISGNPFDFRANDMRVSFVAPDGFREERLAYFDHGQWKAWLVSMHPGSYEATLTHNGRPAGAPPVNVLVRDDPPIPGGFVHAKGRHFMDDDGRPYFPLGHNLGWQDPAVRPLVEQLRGMGAAGMNWTRVWACAWDGKNPFVSRGQPPPPPGALSLPVMRTWDDVITTAEASGVRLQMVLFHHGLFSTEVNSNWKEHPWNQANAGGFLARPQDFFTDPTARDYTQRWLRYAVARWGHSPAILAWELFNEVEWVDTVRKDHDWATIAAWHTDMAAFIRSIDPYHHMITTSSALEFPGLYAAMDYYQPHVYTRSLTIAIAGASLLPDKPWFFGEFGGNATGPASLDERLLARDGVWASILAGHGGAAGYWYWERVEQQHFANEFTHAARALAWSRLPERADAKPMAVTLTGAKPAPLVVAAGRGWTQTTQYGFDLPDHATPSHLAGLSSYLRPTDPKKPGDTVPPVVFRFTAPADGQATLSLTGTGARGSHLVVKLDGHEVAAPSWPPLPPRDVAGGPRRPHADLEPITINYPPGSHVLTLDCAGPDWVQFRQITFSDLGRTSQAMAIGAADFALARVTSTENGVPAQLDLHFEGLADGAYTLDELNLDTGAETKRDITIASGTLRGWEATVRDVVLVISR